MTEKKQVGNNVKKTMTPYWTLQKNDYFYRQQSFIEIKCFSFLDFLGACGTRLA